MKYVLFTHFFNYFLAFLLEYNFMLYFLPLHDSLYNTFMSNVDVIQDR